MPTLKLVAGSSALVGEVGRDQEMLANARQVTSSNNADKQSERSREFRVRNSWLQISREYP